MKSKLIILTLLASLCLAGCGLNVNTTDPVASKSIQESNNKEVFIAPYSLDQSNYTLDPLVLNEAWVERVWFRTAEGLSTGVEPAGSYQLCFTLAENNNTPFATEHYNDWNMNEKISNRYVGHRGEVYTLFLEGKEIPERIDLLLSYGSGAKNKFKSAGSITFRIADTIHTNNLIKESVDENNLILLTLFSSLCLAGCGLCTYEGSNNSESIKESKEKEVFVATYDLDQRNYHCDSLQLMEAWVERAWSNERKKFRVSISKRDSYQLCFKLKSTKAALSFKEEDYNIWTGSIRDTSSPMWVHLRGDVFRLFLQDTLPNEITLKLFCDSDTSVVRNNTITFRQSGPIDTNQLID